MKKYAVYIGENNTTGELEVAKAEAIAARFFPGFTRFIGIGFWLHQREQTMKLEILTKEPDTKVMAMAHAIGSALQQKEILVEEILANFTFVAMTNVMPGE